MNYYQLEGLKLNLKLPHLTNTPLGITPLNVCFDEFSFHFLLQQWHSHALTTVASFLACQYSTP
jgi:hypothetical protein